MNTREYIGARYVPKFSNPYDWDKNRRYEALEIVYHNNASYISRIPVPIGIDINNTEYWLFAANYNGQIEEFRRETALVLNQYSSLVQNSEKLIGKSWITNPVTSNDAVLSNPNRVLVIGDSYNDEGRNQYVVANVTTWGNHLKKIMGFSDDNFKTYGLSGAGWTCKGNAHSHSELRNMSFGEAVRYLHTAEHYYDKIIICGGLNDLFRAELGETDIADIPQIITDTVEYIHTINKNCDVYIGVCGYAFHSGYGKMKKLIETICGITGCKFTFLSNIHNSMKGKRYVLSEDFVHPTNEGTLRIAQAVYNALNGNILNYCYHPNIYYTVNNKNNNVGAMSFIVRIDNDVFKMTTYNIWTNLIGYVIPTGGFAHTIEIGEVADYEFTAFNNDDIFNSCYCSMKATTKMDNVMVGSATNPSNVGTKDCTLYLKWYLKSVGNQSNLKTYLMLDLSATCEHNGTVVGIRGGEFSSEQPIFEVPLTSDTCSSLNI